MLLVNQNKIFHWKRQNNKDENVHRFALSAIRGELFEREKREKLRERKRENKREKARERKIEREREREKERGRERERQRKRE